MDERKRIVVIDGTQGQTHRAFPPSDPTAGKAEIITMSLVDEKEFYGTVKFVGSKKSAEKAPDVLRWLVAYAQANRRDLTYKKLSTLICVHHRAIGRILGVITSSLAALSPEFGPIPRITFLVVRQDSGRPAIPPHKANVDEELRQVFQFQHWHKVLTRFGLEPISLDSSLNQS